MIATIILGGSAITSNFKISTPKSSTLKISTHIWSSSPINILVYWAETSIPHGLHKPGRVAQSVGLLTRKSGVLGSIPCLATYFRFSFRFFKKGSCQLLAEVCARSTG